MIDKRDLAAYIYNYAVVISGAYIIMGLGFDGRVEVFAIGAVFALFWTAYFRWSVAPRLVDEAEVDDEVEELPGDA